MGNEQSDTASISFKLSSDNKPRDQFYKTDFAVTQLMATF